MGKTHVVFAGNPGVGKSTILNALIGEVVFKSGVNMVDGLTTALHTHEANDRIYCDTPGLDDINQRERAALEISRALRAGAEIKLIFVCTLESGRIRSADLTTIRVVLKAIEDVGVDTASRYSVLINKCGEEELSECGKPRGIEKVRIAYSRYKAVDHIAFFPKIAAADDKKDVLISNEHATGYNAFLDEAPTLPIPTGANVSVDPRQFDEIEEQYQRELAELKKKLQDIESERDDLRWAQRFLEQNRNERERLEKMLDRMTSVSQARSEPSANDANAAAIGRVTNVIGLGIPGALLKAYRYLTFKEQ